MIRSDEETLTSAIQHQSVEHCTLELQQNNDTSSESKENESLMEKLVNPILVITTSSTSTFNNLKVDDTQEELLFTIDQSPPWHITLLLAFQHYLTMIGGTISVPFLLSPALCIEDSDPIRSSIISTIIFVSGIITVLQSTIGSRLPIIQGGSFSFVVPTFAILSLPEWKCPAVEEMANMTYEDKTDLWQQRMREIQGAIIIASLFEVAVGMFGIVGLILRFITPLTIAPSITMVGMSLFRSAGDMAGTHWGISSLTIALLILFSLYLRNVKCVYPSYKRNAKSTKKGEWIFRQFDIFTLLPVLLSIGTVWTVCIILTVSGVLSEDSAARTDKKVEILMDAPWFRVPYPGQWGWPTVSLAAVFGIFAGVLASSVESIGDYYACARLAGAKPPPNHAINRGLMIEGFGCVLAGLFGTGNGTTSISQNIGAIGITKVGSRRVVQVAGVILLVCGVLSKVGALFITMPIPILGGIFCVMFAMITATGLANLQFIDLNSSRNLLVLGFSIFFSLVLSQWMKAYPNAIDTGYETVDQVLTVLLSTTMFLSGIIGFILDNTVPGTPEERGLTKWLTHQPNEQFISSTHDNDQGPDDQQEDVTKECSYDIPYITPWLKKQSWASYIPFLPSFGFQHTSVLNVE